jgi:hypothetical protein
MASLRPSNGALTITRSSRVPRWTVGASEAAPPPPAKQQARLAPASVFQPAPRHQPSIRSDRALLLGRQAQALIELLA